MKPIRCLGGSSHRLSAAFALLAMVLLNGCGALFVSSPPPLDLPTGAAQQEQPAENQAWWHARFRFFWPEGEDPRWHLDLLVADRLVKPVLIEHRDEIALWRVHRRAGRDGAGHQFSFLFYTNREAARRILTGLRQAPLIGELKNAGLLESIVFDDPDARMETDIGATSDAHWSMALQNAWPYYIMGVSAMWIELIHQVAGDDSPSDASPEGLAAYYRKLDQRVDRIWEEEAQHALLHHLNAVFGYRPLMIQKRMRF